MAQKPHHVAKPPCLVFEGQIPGSDSLEPPKSEGECKKVRKTSRASRRTQIPPAESQGPFIVSCPDLRPERWERCRRGDGTSLKDPQESYIKGWGGVANPDLGLGPQRPLWDWGVRETTWGARGVSAAVWVRSP